MRYLGGKSRIAKYIAAEINKVRRPGQLVWDAFCGGLSVSVALSKHGPVLATDANAALINLYKAVQNGWQPPAEVSKETWLAAKLLPDTDPMKAFCAIGCSYGGDWSGGYANDRKAYPEHSIKATSHASSSRNALKRQVPKVASFACVDFLSSEPKGTETVIYCDPPYSGTTRYTATGFFDDAAFLSKLASWSAFADVFVSEYDFPIGIQIWERPSPGGCCLKTKAAATERLYHLPKGSTW